ncbi:DUF6207 family protein [Streptomyces sp. ISL-22]|uniref:DUF6207 family protein n=1 Tax=Streptomyces sp. ISL-22 TaxID=2819180 RepID=UPI0025533FF0|nr:DUF6207 family protein [Streptomyces sp. ISL-22]
MGSDFSAVPAAPPGSVRSVTDGGRPATSDRTTRDPGQPNVRLHCYLDVRQELNTSPRRGVVVR